VDPRDKKIEEQAREIRRWQARAERAEALVELQKNVALLNGQWKRDEAVAGAFLDGERGATVGRGGGR
jgi:hypothetical protein